MPAGCPSARSFFGGRRRFTQQNLLQTTVLTVAGFAAGLASLYLRVRP